MRIRRILHPTDFSAASGRAFKVAVQLARNRAALLLLHVLAPVPVVPDVYVAASVRAARGGGGSVGLGGPPGQWGLRRRGRPSRVRSSSWGGVVSPRAFRWSGIGLAGSRHGRLFGPRPSSSGSTAVSRESLTRT